MRWWKRLRARLRALIDLRAEVRALHNECELLDARVADARIRLRVLLRAIGEVERAVTFEAFRSDTPTTVAEYQSAIRAAQAKWQSLLNGFGDRVHG